MRNVADILSSMYGKGVKIWIHQGQLRCSASVGVLTRQDISLLRDLKADIIDALGESQSLAAVLQRPMPRASAGPAPLSYQQEGLWNARHDINLVPSMALRLSGPFNVQAFRRALTGVVHRHESLRTRIVLIENVPKQQIDEPGEYPLEIGDLSGRSRAEAESDAKRLIETFFGEEPNPETNPLFQVRLLKLTEHEHVIAVLIDHLITDAISIALMFRELWCLYEDFAWGREPSLPPASLQYADYAIWQRSTRSFWERKNGDYWEERISGAKPTNFPFDHGLESIEPNTAAALQVSLGKALSNAVCDLARNERTTPAMILLAVCVGVLSRWCNQENFGILSIVSGRDVPKLDSVMGFLVHVFYFRVKLSGRETFIDLLKNVSQEFRSAWEHLECGMVTRRGFETTGDMGSPALFQWLPWDPCMEHVIAASAQGDPGALLIEAFSIENRPGIYGKAYGTLQLNFFESTQGICGTGYYRADLFNRSTMEYFVQNLQRFCHLLVLNPKFPLASFQYEARK